MTPITAPITIRLATDDDRARLIRLAALDSAEAPPPGRLLLAEVDGQLRAALSLADGSAIADRSVGSADWLVGEVVSYRGEAVVLEPADLRARVAQRARELGSELRPARTRA